MKKHTIWILTVVMAVTVIILLGIQIFYMRDMVRMRYDQFAQSVRQSLIAVSLHLSHDETQRFLEEDVNNIESSSIYQQYLGDATPQLGGVRYSFTTSTGLEADLTIQGEPSEISNIEGAPALFGHSRNTARKNNYNQPLRVKFNEQFMQQKNLIDNVILDIMSKSSSRPITERADSATVRKYLRMELDTLGLKVPFEFALVNRAGVPVYKTAGFQATPDDEDNMFVQALFPQDGAGKIYYLKVFFPTKKDFVYSSLPFLWPAFILTLILLVVFVFTIVTGFRQKKLSEMKNDFINNMTHEFKTPISSISLAAQMLQDQSVRKSPTMLAQISNVINDETKRLRFQVEKVLQMSMFEGRKATMKLTEVDANVVIYNIVNTFKLKVEKYGGHINAHLDAMDAIVEVDEMHFTNVIFNLLDNAVKYRREDVPLELTVTSRDIPGERLEITVGDNGIGIAKDDQKKVFDKFFRVSTGNLHDVKGFGLGLAYVKKIVYELGGTINVESQLEKGTKFIIIIPLSKN